MAAANTLFVGNLPFNASDDDIALAFAAYGCTSSKMQYHEDSGRSKGWALVQVSTDVATVIDAMHDTEFQGRKLLVREDRGPPKKEPRPPRNARAAPRQYDENEVIPESNVMYVGNLPWDVDSAMLAEYFPDHVEAVVQTRRDGRSSGFGLVTYETIEQASNAIAGFNGMEVNGRQIVCRYNKGGYSRAAENEVVAESNSVFVGNLPWSVDSAQLSMFFPGSLEAIVQTRRDGSSAGYGIVKYSTTQEANEAILYKNGININGRDVVCRFDRG